MAGLAGQATIRRRRLIIKVVLNFRIGLFCFVELVGCDVLRMKVSGRGAFCASRLHVGLYNVNAFRCMVRHDEMCFGGARGW